MYWTPFGIRNLQIHKLCRREHLECMLKFVNTGILCQAKSFLVENKTMPNTWCIKSCRIRHGKYLTFMLFTFFAFAYFVSFLYKIVSSTRRICKRWQTTNSNGTWQNDTLRNVGWIYLKQNLRIPASLWVRSYWTNKTGEKASRFT